MLKTTRIRRSNWTDTATNLVVEIWHKYTHNLLGEEINKKNIYDEMANQLKVIGFEVTEKEVRCKISNMTQRYREERKKLETSSEPSDWNLFKVVDDIMKLSKKKWNPDLVISKKPSKIKSVMKSETATENKASEFTVENSNSDMNSQTSSSFTENVPMLTENVPMLTENVPMLTENIPTSTENISTLTENLQTSTKNDQTLTENVLNLTENISTSIINELAPVPFAVPTENKLDISEIKLENDSFQMNPNLKKKKDRVVWSKENTIAILDMWAQQTQRLRGDSNNRNVYVHMANEFAKTDFHLTSKDIRIKINNMIQRYKDERGRLCSDYPVSSWVYYGKIDQIMKTRIRKRKKTIDSSFSNTLSYLGSPNINSNESSTEYNKNIHNSQPLQLNESSAMLAIKPEGNYSQDSSSYGTSNSLWCANGTTIKMEDSSEESLTATQDSTKLKAPTLPLLLKKEMQTVDEMYKNTKQEGRKIYERLLENEQKFLENHLRFQTELLSFLEKRK